MSDHNLNDDMVKLVEYSIISIERGHETILVKRDQKLVTDKLTDNAFANGRIAEWLAKNPGAHTGDPDDLRVYYSVLARWPKQDLKFDEKTVHSDAKRNELLEKLVEQVKGLNHTFEEASAEEAAASTGG